MHHSRLSTFVIDCKTDDLDAAAAFWGGALGRPAHAAPDGDPKYRMLESKDIPRLVLQAVDHESRIHLDIETDNLDAEVRRLEALGARRAAQGKHWWIMEAPTGHRFCVVDRRRLLDATNANVWP